MKSLIISVFFVCFFVPVGGRAGAEVEKPFSFKSSKKGYCFIWEKRQRGHVFECNSSIQKLREWLNNEDKGSAWEWLNNPNNATFLGAYKLEEVK